MAYFYSFISVNRQFLMPDYNERQEMLSMNLIPDGHPSIVEYYQKKGYISLGKHIEDIANKYSYNPLTEKLTISYLNSLDDSESALRHAKLLDYSTIEPQLIIKSTVMPINTNCFQNALCGCLKQYECYDKFYSYVSNKVIDEISLSIWNLLKISFVQKDSYENLLFALSFVKLNWNIDCKF